MEKFRLKNLDCANCAAKLEAGLKKTISWILVLQKIVYIWIKA